MFKNTLRKILNSIPGDVLLAIDVTVFLNKILEKYPKNLHKYGFLCFTSFEFFDYIYSLYFLCKT